MWQLFLLLLILIVLTNLSKIKDILRINNAEEKQNAITDFNKFVSNSYIMTQTELKFYRELKKITDKLQLTIFCQVGLERIIKVADNNFSDRNKIKSRTIDFAIVNNNNCKVVCCIELDDYTHNSKKSKKADAFKDNLFKQVNIPLHRIKVNNYYDLEQIENIIKESLQKPPTLIENNS